MAVLLAATRALLDEGGLTAVTMERVAARAGVGKPTVYRHWPNAPAVAMEAFLETARPPEPAAGGDLGGSALAELRAQLTSVAAAFSARTGRNVRAMVAAGQGETELAKAFRDHFVTAGRAGPGRAGPPGGRSSSGRCRRASCGLGSTSRSRSTCSTARSTTGRLIGHAPLDAAFTDALVDHALRGLAA